MLTWQEDEVKLSYYLRPLFLKKIIHCIVMYASSAGSYTILKLILPGFIEAILSMFS